jgi:two-component system response regulator MprA
MVCEIDRRVVPWRLTVTANVLIVDDDGPVRRTLARTLGAEGYATVLAPDGGAALVEVERRQPDVIVLDAMMPGMDGLAVARRLRSKGISVPILMLTARDAVGDRVAGLDAGADDYLVKPFATEELLARVRALLRRGLEAPLVSFADITLDAGARVLVRGGRTINLTQREAELLELLMQRPGKVLSRRMAMTTVWSDGSAATENVVDRYVAYLRRKLGDPPLIHTVRGAGFVLRR